VNVATEKRGRKLLVENMQKTFIFYLCRIGSSSIAVKLLKCELEVEQKSVSKKAKSGLKYIGQDNCQLTDKKIYLDKINLGFLLVLKFLLAL